MREQKEVKIPYWTAYLTTTVSVTLVLLIIGVIALLSIGAAQETRRLKEKIELSVIMADSVSNEQALQLCNKIKREPYAANVRLITKEEALKAWKEDTGEDLEHIFGVNILSPEISFSLRADYASQAQIGRISAALAREQGVEQVSSPDAGMIDSMNSNIERLTWVLGAVALVMVVISFLLINNTVHLTVYSRRFTIHTMQLVGATDSFIRAPFFRNNILAGALSGAIASAVIIGAYAGAGQSSYADIAAVVSWGAVGIVCGGLVVCGVLICGISALISTTRFLRKDYDQLFK